MIVAASDTPEAGLTRTLTGRGRPPSWSTCSRATSSMPSTWTRAPAKRAACRSRSDFAGPAKTIPEPVPPAASTVETSPALAQSNHAPRAANVSSNGSPGLDFTAYARRTRPGRAALSRSKRSRANPRS